jgi:sterol desaturase/sphingolipid hydroxylase (fatty acid hydroxylase superfamily)
MDLCTILDPSYWAHYAYCTRRTSRSSQIYQHKRQDYVALEQLDLWITEVIPTVIFSWITGHWWLSVFYYLWAALIQEVVEHNPKFDVFPLLTSGRWHLVHHKDSTRNYGLFLPIWDIMFGTYKSHKVAV